MTIDLDVQRATTFEPVPDDRDFARWVDAALQDLKQAAVVVAATAYHLAMRDEMMPRKPVETPTTD